MNKEYFMDINEIQKRIPHRYPFLLIDRVLSFEYGEDKESFKGRKVVARKCVSGNELFFQGHFPGNPIMPGVLQVEAMAQAGALACVPEQDDKVDVLIAKINESRFRQQVVPGDVLEIHAEITSEKRGLLVVVCKTFVDGSLVSEASVLAKVMKK